MDWLAIGLIGSIALNILLFFRGPLNELASRLGLNWLNRREQQKAIRQQAYAEVGAFGAKLTLLIVYTVLLFTPEARQLLTQSQASQWAENLLGEYAKHYDFLEKNFLSFSPAVRALLKELRTVSWLDPKVGPEGLQFVDQAKALAATKEVLRLVTAIREELEREL